MSSRHHHDVHDPGGTIHLRPHSATAISAVVAVFVVGLGLDAVIRAGWEGVLVLPALLLVAALVWMVLWAPKVVLHEEAVEVRNVLVTHLIPFAALEDVRIGAMLRFDVSSSGAATRSITAWNAPALGRDKPVRREVAMRQQELQGRRYTPQERLVQDQRRSRSAVVKERWERWLGRRRLTGAPPAEDAGTAMTTRINVIQIGVVAVLSVLVVLRIVL